MRAWLTAAFMGAQLALRRLGGRSTLLITLATISFVTLAAWAERHAAANTAASTALRGPGFGLAIPLAALSLVTVALAKSRLDDAFASVALLGGSRRAAATGALAGTGVVATLLCTVAAMTTALIAHGGATGESLGDAWTAGWIGGVTGAAYVFYFGFFSSFGKRGGGRVVGLLADLVLGPLAGVAAVVFPRAHALNLLGAEPVLELPQTASTAILASMLVVFGAFSTLRTRA